MEKLKVFFQNNKRWIYTLEYILISIILLLIAMLLDLKVIDIQRFLPSFMYMKLGLSTNILTTLAAAFLTITTFTFSTILTVLSSYASNFTPRAVENFVDTKITMKVLGIFIGGFFYCVSSLLYLRELYANEAVISGFIAIIYSIVSIIYFVKFVQVVATKFQAVNLIAEIFENAKEVIKGEIEQRSDKSSTKLKNMEYTVDISANDSGYLGNIDSQKILSELGELGANCKIVIKLGEYAVKGQTVAKVGINEHELDEEKIKNLEECFFFQDNKISTEDYRCNMTKLLEIALRAISPGINDPNTAIHCINKMATLLVPLAEVPTNRIKLSGNDHNNIYYNSYSFEDDMQYYFVPLINYGKGDVMVCLSILRAMKVIGYNATQDNKRIIQEIVKYLEQKTEEELCTDMEKRLIKSETDKVNKILDRRN